MKKYNFADEYLFLYYTPLTAQETYNKLRCLEELQARRYTPGAFCPRKYSKRRERLVRMFWAFRKMEVTK